MTDPIANSAISPTKTDWLLIVALVALVLPLRSWLICNTEVTARDSIGYIRYALEFEHKPWTKVLRENHQHPGYPILVWLTSMPIRAIDGATTPDNMELATQLVSLVASLVLLAPMYWLGRQFFDRPVSFLATLLYQYLPISAQHLSDGISEPVYLVFLVSGLLQMVHAIRDRVAWRCALCGVFTGLAYLTRPEGALILPAFGLMLVGMQARAAWRCTWRGFFACGSAAVVSAVAVGCTYAIVIGGVTNKPAARVTMLIEERSVMTSPPALATASNLFAVTFPHVENKVERLGRSVLALTMEVTQGFHYLAGVPALLGFWWSFGSLRRQPAFWSILFYGSIHAFILIALAMRAYYISDRHVMILVLGGCFFVVFGLRELPRRVLAWRQTEEYLDMRWHRSAPFWFGMLFLALIGFCLPKATQRLHGNRVANHQAGLWLSEQVKDGDVVEDDHAWSFFFSGLVFLEWRDPAYPSDLKATCYIVTTRSNDPHIDQARQAVLLATEAKVVYHWPAGSAVQNARVVVYAQPRDAKRHPWRVVP